MILVGILSIVCGIVLAIWTFIQGSSSLANVSDANVTKYATYFRDYTGISSKIESAKKALEDAQAALSEITDTTGQVYANAVAKVEAAQETLDGYNRLNQAMPIGAQKLGGLTDGNIQSLYTLAIVFLVVGIICVLLYAKFDCKRRNVVKATAIERFNSSKTTFFAGIIAAVVGLVMCIYGWMQSSTLTATLQKAVDSWNAKVDKYLYQGDAKPEWESWLKMDQSRALNDFQAGSAINMTIVNIATIVGAILLIVGVVLAVSVVGKACKTKLYPVFNGLLLIILAFIILFPMYKTLIDSIDATAGNGIYLLPRQFTMDAYEDIVTQEALYRPFIISVITTVSGTLLGLTLSTLGAYVLIQFDMPGRNFFAMMLLFTMIFSGGMIPSYLLMSDLKLLNTLWAVILPMSISVYNLVLMRNFFEGIPASLFEAAQIDGCTPMQIFYKIVLPLSKAAIASIGLMFSVSFWNDYTNFQLYIPSATKYQNFQMKLRGMISGADSATTTTEVYTTETLQSAAVIVAILPFMALYPFCQNYFVQGVNVGAVKE